MLVPAFRCAVIVTTLFAYSTLVFAAERPISFTNMSPESITAITARDQQTADALLVSFLTAELAVGDVAQASEGLPDDVCVVEITITFASGASKILPDTDLCQTDQIAVE